MCVCFCSRFGRTPPPLPDPSAGPPTGPPKISLFFFFFLHTFHSFLSWSPFVDFGVFVKRQDPKCARLEFLGLSCEARNFGPPTLGPHPSGCGANPKIQHPKIGRSRIGRTRKKKLAEVEIGRNRPRSIQRPGTIDQRPDRPPTHLTCPHGSRHHQLDQALGVASTVGGTVPLESWSICCRSQGSHSIKLGATFRQCTKNNGSSSTIFPTDARYALLCDANSTTVVQGGKLPPLESHEAHILLAPHADSALGDVRNSHHHVSRH